MKKESELRQQLMNCGADMDKIDKYIKQFIKDTYKKYDDKSNASIDWSMILGNAKLEILTSVYATILSTYISHNKISSELQTKFVTSYGEYFENLNNIDNNQDDKNDIILNNVISMSDNITDVTNSLTKTAIMGVNIGSNLMPKLVAEYFDEQLRIYRNNKKK